MLDRVGWISEGIVFSFLEEYEVLISQAALYESHRVGRVGSHCSSLFDSTFTRLSLDIVARPFSDKAQLDDNEIGLR